MRRPSNGRMSGAGGAPGSWRGVCAVSPRRGAGASPARRGEGAGRGEGGGRLSRLETEHHCHGELGLPVLSADADAGAVERAQRPRGERGAAVHDVPQRGERGGGGRVRGGALGERLEYPGDGFEDGRPELADGLEHNLRGERPRGGAGVDDDPRAGVEVEDDVADEGDDVEGGQEAHGAGVALARGGGGGVALGAELALRGPEDARVGERDGLGRGGGARGVQHERGAPLVDVPGPAPREPADQAVSHSLVWKGRIPGGGSRAHRIDRSEGAAPPWPGSEESARSMGRAAPPPPAELLPSIRQRCSKCRARAARSRATGCAEAKGVGSGRVAGPVRRPSRR